MALGSLEANRAVAGALELLLRFEVDVFTELTALYTCHVWRCSIHLTGCCLAESLMRLAELFLLL